MSRTRAEALATVASTVALVAGSLALVASAAPADEITPADEAMLEIVDLLWDLEMLEEMAPEDLEDTLADAEAPAPDSHPSPRAGAPSEPEAEK